MLGQQQERFASARSWGVGQVASPEAKLRDRIEILEEENQQLRDKIAHITGKNDAWAARRAFGLTEAESFIFMMLVRCGQAEYRQLQESIYSDGRLEEIMDTDNAIRAHLKRIRRKTRKFGIDFETVYSFGYRMTEKARATARAILDKTPR